MKNKIFGLILSLAIVLSVGVPAFAQKASKPAAVKTQSVMVTPLDLIANPKEYLNKQVEFTGIFERFSSLGLDYDKAFRSSKDYTSFLIKREGNEMPLSEMKLFIKRSAAQKLMDLESGDKIKVRGKVFSDALGDPWVEAEKVEIIQKAKKKASVKQ